MVKTTEILRVDILKLISERKYIELRNKFLRKQGTEENKKLLKILKNTDDYCCG